MNPVDAYDAYDAFAAMVKQGLSANDISKEFGIEVRTVQERLRYGRVHPTIRDAARAGDISLDALKAFATHPSQDAQFRVFEGLSEAGNVQAWTVRSRLKEASIQMGDTLGQFVGDAYRRKGGELEEALFPEETVLLDRSLAEEIAADQLHTVAAQIADIHGFGWAESRLSMDHGAFSAYGRIYPRYEDPSEEDAARLDEINDERKRLYNAEVSDPTAHESITEKIAELNREAEAIDQSLQRYDPEKARKAGVIVSLGRNGPEVHAGLIRPDQA